MTDKENLDFLEALCEFTAMIKTSLAMIAFRTLQNKLYCCTPSESFLKSVFKCNLQMQT